MENKQMKCVKGESCLHCGSNYCRFVDELDQLKAKNEELKAKIKYMEEYIQTVENARNDLERELEQKEQECEQLRNKLNSNIERMNEQNEKLHNENKELKSYIKEDLVPHTQSLLYMAMVFVIMANGIFAVFKILGIHKLYTD